MAVEIAWEHYPRVSQSPYAHAWLEEQGRLLQRNTVEAYGRGLEDYVAFLEQAGSSLELATRADVAAYVGELATRPNRRGTRVRVLDSGLGLSNATMKQRLTAVRLFYDYLCEEGLRSNNPVGRGRYTAGKGFGGTRERGLIPTYRKLPWIPSEDQWQAILDAVQSEQVRNRTMFAFAYDAALRREELCLLETADIDPAHRLLRIRSETTKNRVERMVPYSEATSILYAHYLDQRRQLSRLRGPVFLSASRRNCAEPISIWTWSKIVEGISRRSGVAQFTTHTLRHLCLTDLAYSGWDIHEIANFAGHRSIQTTLLYIHLSARDLTAKLESGMASIHAWRAKVLVEALS